MERLRLYFFMFIVRLYYRIDTKKQCKSRKCLIYTVLSGERGIRTPGGVTLNGFQDRRNRPLCHLSF